MISSLTFVGDGVSGLVELTLGATRAVYLAELVTTDGVVVVRDDDVPLPRGALIEVRADGLWAELVPEADDHWSFGLEAFGLRFDTLDEARASEVGERVPVGADLEWDRGRVVGEVLIGRARLAVDGTGTFTIADLDTPT
jgi:hypothetical protein